MRALVVLEVEVPDGRRPGTRFERLGWVARSLGQHALKLRRVQSVHSVEVYRTEAGDALGPPLLDALAPEAMETGT